MKAELYIPYYPEGEIAGSGNEMSDEEYANKLMETFGGGYNSFMERAMFTDTRHGMSYVMPEKYMIKSAKDRTDVGYYGFECEINDENDKSMSNDEFMFYVKTNDLCAFFIHLTITDDGVDGSAINELNFWLKESSEIMRNPHINEDHKFMMLPHKDLFLKIQTEDNPMFLGKYVLCGTRVVEQDDNNNFAIIVTKIEKSE